MVDDTDELYMSIGAVSRETEIPAGTLRTWERRYGFPDPDRNEAGHRIYKRESIARLRLTHRAIEAGYRASNVVGMTIAELRELIEARARNDSVQEGVPGDGRAAIEVEEDRGWLADWLRASYQLDGDTLTRHFRNDWNRLGGLRFLQTRAIPFLQKIGDEWASDELNIVHEHYTTEVLRDFLSAQWRPQAARSIGPDVLLAGPEGEEHALGLHLVACIFALAGWKILFVGSNTPASDVVEAVRTNELEAVAVSIAPSYRSGRATAFLAELEDELPDGIELLVGGGGAPNLEEVDIRTFGDLESLHDWAFDRAH